MQKPGKTRGEPVVLTIRMRGPLAALASILMVLGLLPFLGGSSIPARQALLLSADAAHGNPGLTDRASTSDSAPTPQPSLDTAPFERVAAVAMQGAHGAARGGGLVLFPSIEMAPLAFDAIAAPISDQPGFIRPVDGPEASGFGPRIHPVLGRAMFHTGIDLMAPCGTPIKAAAAGTVEYAAVSNSWGGRIIIAHTPTLKTAYGHLSQFIAHQGDVVKQGDIIGLVGTTGWSTGCHLHWDVIINDRYVDPAPYLGLPASHAATIPFPGPGGGSSSNPSPEPTSSAPAVPDGDVPIPVPTDPTTVTPPTTAKSTSTSKPPTVRPTKPSASPTPTSTPTSTSASPTPSSTAPSSNSSTPSSTAPSSNSSTSSSTSATKTSAVGTTSAAASASASSKSATTATTATTAITATSEAAAAAASQVLATAKAATATP